MVIKQRNIIIQTLFQKHQAVVIAEEWNVHVIKGWNVIISKDRAQKGKRKATAAAAIADGWNIKDKPYQALSYLIMFAEHHVCDH